MHCELTGPEVALAGWPLAGTGACLARSELIAPGPLIALLGDGACDAPGKCRILPVRQGWPLGTGAFSGAANDHGGNRTWQP